MKNNQFNLRKFEMIALGVAFIISSPTFTMAQSIDEIKAQIRTLLLQLSALQATSTLPRGTSTPLFPKKEMPPAFGVRAKVAERCPELTLNLRRGSRDAITGGEVTRLQQFLADHYGLDEKDAVSGYFGPMTEKYAMRFQQENDIPAVGAAGPATRARIAKLCIASASSTPPARPHDFQGGRPGFEGRGRPAPATTTQSAAPASATLSEADRAQLASALSGLESSLDELIGLLKSP
ncbi:MAG: peptidoglycan-binding protein [Candidatus Kaiserbacteria bacterium]|nr:MAG: peptidoglycan-binding protein [Candidatus Kaiserbacteria bacterium]